MIQTKSFDHSGGFYFYRLHQDKICQVCNGYDSLRQFLQEMLHNCPHDLFQAGPRISLLKFSLPVALQQLTGHEISSLTREALQINKHRFKQGHSKVQVFLLERDDKTIACEIPIWLDPKELATYQELFQSNLSLTGHIDLLRIEDDKIWVWDYKPRAFDEKYAPTQVFFYALMLSKRTGISLDNFRCGYFDDAYAFVFKPSLDLLEQEQLAHSLDS